MEFFFLVIALITAGLSLAMGSVSLISGLSKDGEKVDLVFGIMCLSLFIFFITPPIGFVWLDKAPYPGYLPTHDGNAGNRLKNKSFLVG
jgi:hypothetical protein